MLRFREFSRPHRAGVIAIRVSEISEIEQDPNHEDFSYISMHNGHSHQVVGAAKFIVREIEEQGY